MATPPHLPAFRTIVAGLGLDALDPATADRVPVEPAFLAFLIAEFARSMPFDAAFYAATYPDIAAGLRTGAIADAHDHFIHQGYREGRLPHPVAFEPGYYARRNPDLAGLAADVGLFGLHTHFLHHGWQEGRTAHPDAEAPARRWWQALQATPYRLAHRTLREATVQAFLPPLISGPPLGFRGGPVLTDSPADRRLRHRRGGEPVDSFLPRPAPTTRLLSDYVYAGPVTDHFGHAMAETLHRILPARAAFACRRLLFVGLCGEPALAGFADLPAVMQAPLHFLGVDPGDVTVIHRDCIVETLHMAEQGSILVGGPTAPYLGLLAAYSPPRLDALWNGEPAASRLYVSRSRLRDGGTILGERHFERLLAAEGWQIIHPQDHSLVAQMQAYHRAETILFAEGSAVHGAELLPALGHCLLLPRRNTEAWWIEAALRPRARRLDILPRGPVLGTILADPDTGAPVENYGVTLMDLPAVAAALRGLGLARLPRLDRPRYRAAARADLAAYLAIHRGPNGPALPSTRLIAPAELADFEARALAAIG